MMTKSICLEAAVNTTITAIWWIIISSINDNDDDDNNIIIIIITTTILLLLLIITIIIIIISSSSSSSRRSSSSSSSTQRSTRGPVDEMHVFQKMCSRLGQKQLFKSTSMQKHTFLIWSAKQTKKWLSPRRDAPFRVYFYIIQTTKQKKGSRLGEMHILS